MTMPWLVKCQKAPPPLDKSDHAVLYFKLSCYKDFPQEEFVEKFKYDKGDYEAIQDDLSKINWDDELDTQTVDDAWNVFINHFTDTMDKNIPKTKPPKQMVGGKKWKPLWMSKEAMKKVRKKYHTWKRYSNTRQYQDFLNYWNLASKGVRNAKRKFEKFLASQIKKNPKCFGNTSDPRQRWRLVSMTWSVKMARLLDVTRIKQMF